MISISGSWHSTTIKRHYPPTTTTTSTPFSSSSKYLSKAKYQSTASSPSAKYLTRTSNLLLLSKSLNNGSTIISKRMNKLSWNTSSSMLASHHLVVGTFTSSLSQRCFKNGPIKRLTSCRRHSREINRNLRWHSTVKTWWALSFNSLSGSKLRSTSQLLYPQNLSNRQHRSPSPSKSNQPAKTSSTTIICQLQ
jgi:hypothetical protein